MSLQNPLALMWLIPPSLGILVLYFLKIKRKDFVVPAAFLWPEVREDVRANSLFQRLRPSWLLALQLLALSLVGLAFARPQLLQSGRAGGDTVYVIDTSQSMGARDGEPTRLDQAKRIVSESLRASHLSDQIAIVASAQNASIVFPLSNDAAKGQEALRSIQQTDTEGGMAEALDLAEELVGQNPSGHIVVVSDGCFAPIKDFNPGKAQLSFEKVGARANNIGIESLSARNVGDKKYLYCGLHNYGAANQTVEVNIYGDGAILSSSEIEVPAGNSAGKTMMVANFEVYEAKIATNDLLASDDYAATVGPGHGQIKALVVTQGDIFLERALALDPRVSVDRSAKVPDDTSSYDLVVLDSDGAMGQVKSRYVVAFGSSASSGSATESAKFVSQERQSVVEAADFSSFEIGRAYPITGGTKTLVAGSEGPLLTESELGGQAQILCGIDLLKSEFPLTVAFPIFIGNILDRVADQPRTASMVIAPGRTFAYQAGGEVRVSDSQNHSFTIQPQGGFALISGLNQVGLWTLSSSGKATKVYVTAQEVHDSDINPKLSLAIGDKGNPIQGRSTPHHADQWKAVLLLTLVILAAEWWLFAKKS